jgi:hypothetical protein
MLKMCCRANHNFLDKGGTIIITINENKVKNSQ